MRCHHITIEYMTYNEALKVLSNYDLLPDWFEPSNIESQLLDKKIFNLQDELQFYETNIQHDQDCAHYARVIVNFKSQYINSIYISKYGGIAGLLENNVHDENLILGLNKSDLIYIPNEFLNLSYKGRLSIHDINYTWWNRFLDFE